VEILHLVKVLLAVLEITVRPTMALAVVVGLVLLESMVHLAQGKMVELELQHIQLGFQQLPHK
jgi:hypothetical protein